MVNNVDRIKKMNESGIKVNDFKNFEQFIIYNKQHAEEMKYWDTAKIGEFAEKVSKLREKSPEFREKYDEWTKKLELQARVRNVKIKLGGSDDELASSVAYLKLKKIMKDRNKKDKTPADIRVINKRKVFEI